MAVALTDHEGDVVAAAAFSAATTGGTGASQAINVVRPFSLGERATHSRDATAPSHGNQTARQSAVQRTRKKTSRNCLELPGGVAAVEVILLP